MRSFQSGRPSFIGSQPSPCRHGAKTACHWGFKLTWTVLLLWRETLVSANVVGPLPHDNLCSNSFLYTTLHGFSKLRYYTIPTGHDKTSPVPKWWSTTLEPSHSASVPGTTLNDPTMPLLILLAPLKQPLLCQLPLIGIPSHPMSSSSSMYACLCPCLRAAAPHTHIESGLLLPRALHYSKSDSRYSCSMVRSPGRTCTSSCARFNMPNTGVSSCVRTGG